MKTAVLLVGGLGTRLRPLTYLVPKPLLPVLDLPLVGHQILWLARNGLERVILAAGYKAELLEQGLKGRDWGVEVTVVEEPEPLDTAGALRFAAAGLRETFVATNGDLILNPSLAEMLAGHEAAGAVATILLRRVEDVSHYGLVLRGEGGRVTHFLEKHPADETGQRTVNAGVYLLHPSVLNSVPEGTSWSVETQLFPDLLAAGATVYGHLPAQPYYWMDVGRLETYREAHRDLLSGEVEWCGPGVVDEAVVSAKAELVAPVRICAGARIGPGAKVGPYVSVGAGAEVAEEALVRDSVVWSGAQVGRGASVCGSVVATGARVPDADSVSDGIVMPE